MFKKAERSKSKLRLALCGVSGSGKTYSALLIAKGLGGRIALIDTENKSACNYAGNDGLPDFDNVDLQSPFEPKKYIRYIKEAEKEKYDVLIIDSLSHAWFGTGGVLDIVDKASAVSNNNSYVAWRKGTPEQNDLVEAIVQSNLHVIVTIRCKESYEIVENEKGKKVPVKMGLAPIQREGISYEFTTVFDMSVKGNYATCSKDRTGLFNDKVFKPTEETGVELVAWLNSGIEPAWNKEKANEYSEWINKAKSNDELKEIFIDAWKYGTELKDKKFLEDVKKSYDVKKVQFAAPVKEIENVNPDA